MTQEQHFDVAAYALGVLDERDAARFEEHLAECPRCPLELESLLPVVDLLGDIDADTLVAAEESRRDGVVLTRMIGEVRQERRRATSRRLYSLAAAVVLFAALALGSMFAGARLFAPDPAPSSTAQAPSDPSQLDVPQGGGPGIGDKTPILIGERLGATDPRTGARLDVGLSQKNWGTQVMFLVSGVPAPATCRLLAVRTDGQAEVLSTWTVRAQDHGSATQGSALMLVAATALRRPDIAHLSVQSVDANGTSQTLVSTP